jgi:hypothetical protein
MHVNSWLQKPHCTHKLWHAMTNINAINSRHMKTYDVTKNHGLSWKFVAPCCQMACHVIITWKTKLLLITNNNNIFSYLINEINPSNHRHESWCEVRVTNHEMLRLSVNLIAMWHAASTSHDHKLLYSPKLQESMEVCYYLILDD